TGFSFQNGECVGGSACPSDSPYQNGQCTKTTTPTNCPSGFDYKNGQCEDGNVCPSDWSYKNGQCTYVTAPLCNTSTGYCEYCGEYDFLGHCKYYSSYYACNFGSFENGQCIATNNAPPCPSGSN